MGVGLHLLCIISAFIHITPALVHITSPSFTFLHPCSHLLAIQLAADFSSKKQIDIHPAMAVNWQKVFTHAEYEFHFLEENSQADEGVHFLADFHTAHVIWLQHEKHFFHPPDILDYFIWQEDCQMKFSLGNVQWYIGNQLLISHFITI